MDTYLSLIGSAAVPLFAIVVVAGWFLYSMKQRAAIQQSTANYQAGALAQQLGMRVVRGDPGTNLFVTGKTSLEDQRFDVLLQGERHGVPTEIRYFREVSTDAGLFEVTTHRSWEGRLTAYTQAQFGHFEVTLRQPQQWNVVRSYFQHPMPEVPTGDPRTDSLLRLNTDNPAIARPLGALLAPLTSLNYVHVVGQPGQVSFLMSHSGAGRGLEMIGVGYALHDAGAIFDVLARIVLTAEGRA